MALAQWVALETGDALFTAELKQYLRRSYDLVFRKLPKEDASRAERRGRQGRFVKKRTLDGCARGVT